MLAEVSYDPDIMDIIPTTNNGSFNGGNMPMYWLQINIEEHLEIISQWYDVGERNVVEMPQGSIEYYIASQKKM